MPRTTITDFITQMQGCPVIDVRSPGEFAHARMPGAYNLPLFSDEERKVIGTAYKQESREKAIKLGLDYFGPKMRAMVEEVERLTAAFATAGNKEYNGRRVLVHCWRGGMRSGAVSWLLQLYGFEVSTLEGGYKAFRNWALEQFSVPYPFAILGGYTGSGKTEILGKMSGKHRSVVIDLEQIAQHKGSAFGGFDAVQPSQEMFENMLAVQLAAASATVGDGQYIWLEDESRRIGDINLPPALWLQMNAAPLFFLDIPMLERVNFITRIYGRHKKEQLVNAIIRIQRRLGSQNTKDAISHLLEDNYPACFTILLHYYDKYYRRGLEEREKRKDPLFAVSSAVVDEKLNCKLILENINKVSQTPGNGTND